MLDPITDSGLGLTYNANTNSDKLNSLLFKIESYFSRGEMVNFAALLAVSPVHGESSKFA